MFLYKYIFISSQEQNSISFFYQYYQIQCNASEPTENLSLCLTEGWDGP